MKNKNQQEKLNQLRHSCSHLLAAAVLELWPNTKPTIGPAIENGFYYDFEFQENISEEDLPKIEKKMREILPTWESFSHREVSADEAKAFYKNNPYKLELIDEIIKKGEKITFYKAGKFEDLCRGGHVDHPNKEIGAFKLLSLAGAYWRGSEKNKMLTRIYGTAFPTQKELNEYLLMLEEAKKRDHKKLGQQLGLFMFHETAPGMPYWLPKGVIIYNELINFWREEHYNRGYQEIMSPLLNKKALYETSGHWEHYRENMFVVETEEKEVYGIKAMNCPNAMIVFGSSSRSYRDLPLRLGDTDTLHRYERSGTLNGLLRVREFRQDDAHIFVTEEQIKSEYQNIFAIVEKFYSIFKISYSFRLGTRPEKYMGDLKTWNKAETALKEILKESGKEYTIEEGDGAFYGPKIDILMKDSLGRSWQMGTIQLDFQQPKNFNLRYTDIDGKEKMPVVIHRVVYGSLERFIGILLEHFAGAFPIWLSPIQVMLLPIADRHVEYAQETADKLRRAKIRVSIDTRSETLQAKIREATLQKVPILGIIGDKEIDQNSISVRLRNGEDQGQVEISQFIQRLREDIDKKTQS
ncbi:MAG: threonine--tRNA ligase [Patescibacteria group bacterium]|nr:MAG: threonine--tRNA ligase [Patescibacteria group bacterium]